jgi:hypothetical protein
MKENPMASKTFFKDSWSSVRIIFVTSKMPTKRSLSVGPRSNFKHCSKASGETVFVVDVEDSSMKDKVVK